MVAVEGEIDAYTAPQLRERLNELLEQRRYEILVDLEGVEFMDSTGLGILVGAHKRAKEHDGTVALVSTRPALLRVFSITGLDKVFPIRDSPDGATAS